MSKAFADVAENNSLRLALLWAREGGFKIQGILLGGVSSDMRKLALDSGACELKSSKESSAALHSLYGLLKGEGDASELEELVSFDACNAFSVKVLKTLRRSVPRGRVISYGRLAELCGSPGGARAVGAAMASNPFPVLYPCHRVLGSDGSLTGFGGGLELKRLMLEMEGVETFNNKVKLKSIYI